MSQNYDESSNPYQSPTHHQGENAQGNPLVFPAIFLLVLGILWLLAIFATIPGHVVDIQQIDTHSPHGQGRVAGRIVGLVVWIAMLVAIIWGSIAMLRLRGYSNAMVAAVVAIIPVCSPCFLLGIPFGIWAIVVLRRPEVRVMFR